MKFRTWSLLAGAALAAIAASCAPAGADDGAQPPSRNTPNYFSTAINPAQFFRWTGVAGYNHIPLFIEVYDSGLEDHDVHVGNVVYARERWKDAIRDNGIAIESYTRLMSQSSPHSTSAARIQVVYVEQLSGLRVGECEAISSGTNRIDRVVVRLAKRSPFTGEKLGAERLRSVALHEFGHALGIMGYGGGFTGHSNNEGDVMYPENIWKWTTLSQGDNLTIDQLYSMWPPILRKDG